MNKNENIEKGIYFYDNPEKQKEVANEIIQGIKGNTGKLSRNEAWDIFMYFYNMDKAKGAPYIIPGKNGHKDLVVSFRTKMFLQLAVAFKDDMLYMDKVDQVYMRLQKAGTLPANIPAEINTVYDLVFESYEELVKLDESYSEDRDTPNMIANL